MRRVPFVVKFALSSGVAFYMCNKLWNNNIYEAELYEVALRYRDRYDKSIMPAHILSPPNDNNTTSSQGTAAGDNNK